ncbi:MAG: RnfABCDGE type electron transport complex subunit D, partial [Phycisphaerae bacterium]|nr:RnfABCDGE type electron transport complex subunit D [Phycisphaerae bacterium]
MSQSHRPNLRPNGPGGGPAGGFEAPFYRAPEAVRTVFLVTLAAACGPLAAGAMLFGWRVLVVAGISVASCTVIERLYYRVTRTPALLGRSHAYLTGILLALTLPAFVPWYVPLIASAFAIIVGKAIFGGVGHFLWQPALVGRLAVAVMFPQLLNPPTWNMLARERLLVGDITIARNVGQFHQWEGRPAPQGADAFKVQPPSAVLAGLTDRQYPAFSALAYQPSPHDVPGPKPAALSKMPQIK